MAGILENPPVLQQPFAYNGDKNTIPLDATGDQRASLQEGFPAITSTPITQGGIPPERKDFNGLGNLLSSLYFYLQNGGQFTFNQQVSDAIGGYPAGAILTYNNASTNQNYRVRSLINNNTFNFVAEPSYIDGVKWEIAYTDEKPGFGNIGDIQYTSRTDVPNGGAWCDGAEYTQAAFPDLYQMLVDGKLQKTDYETFNSSVSTNGSCGFFALDTTTQKFKVPLLKYVYLKAGQTPSMFGAESLPNIKGSFPADGVPSPEGAFYAGEALSYISGSTGGVKVRLDASRSSEAYQDGAKVNPDHVVYRAYVVLYSSAAEASEAQAQEFMTALGGKANVDMSNVSQLGKDTAINWLMPDYPEKNIFNNNFIPWNTAFQLPCDCAVYCGATAGTTNSNNLLVSFSFDGQTFFPVANWYGIYIAVCIGNFPKGMYIKATGGINSQLLGYTPLRGASR